MKIKKPVALLLVLGSFTLSAFAQSTEDISKNVTMRTGIFWPTHEVLGKNFYKGQWFEAPATQPWNTPSQEELDAKLQEAIDIYGIPGMTPDEFAQYWFAENSFQELVDFYYGGDMEQMLSQTFGLSVRQMPATDAEKAAFLAAYDTDEGLTGAQLKSMAETSGQLFGYPPDIEFGIATLEKVWNTTDGWDLNHIISHLAPAFTGEIPPNLDLTQFDFSRLTGLSGVDFTNTKITAEQFNALSSFSEAIFGDYDLNEYSIAGKYITNSDLSRVKNLTGTMLSQTLGEIGRMTLPANADMTGFNPVNKIMTSSDFSNVKNLTANMIAVGHNTGIAYLNVTNTGLKRSDMVTALTARNYTPTRINQILNTWTGLIP